MNKFNNFAIIDIGSVAIRVEIYSISIDQPKNFRLVYSDKCLPKLGNLNQENSIKEEAAEIAADFLKSQVIKLKEYSYDKIYAVGTAVFRQADNANQIKIKLEEILGNNICILSEVDEAKLIASGISQFEKNLPNSYFLLDIGGRSSEVSLVLNNSLSQATSLPIGAISIKNLFFKNPRPTPFEIKQTQEFLTQEFTKLSALNLIRENISIINTIIGSSGTLRMIGRFFKLLHPNESMIPQSFIKSILNVLLENQNHELTSMLVEIEKNRTDLIFSGLILADKITEFMQIKNIQITNYSLRHGLLKCLLEESSLSCGF